MERKILQISSCRDDITERFSYMLRELGKRTKRPLWGKVFNSDEATEALLYLDSGGRGNLNVMAKSMGADTIEYVFYDKETERYYLLLSEVLKSEYRDGEVGYISSKTIAKTLGGRVKEIDSLYGIRNFFSVYSSSLEKSPAYSSAVSEAKKNIKRGVFEEGNLKELFGKEELPDIIISDAFSKNGALAMLENRFGVPLAIQLMNGENRIYAPFFSLEKEIFIETEEFFKQALFAVCRWLSDSGEERCSEMLKEAFLPLFGGEELIERTCRNFMRHKVRKKRAVIK